MNDSDIKKLRSGKPVTIQATEGQVRLYPTLPPELVQGTGVHVIGADGGGRAVLGAMTRLNLIEAMAVLHGADDDAIRVIRAVLEDE